MRRGLWTLSPGAGVGRSKRRPSLHARQHRTAYLPGPKLEKEGSVDFLRKRSPLLINPAKPRTSWWLRCPQPRSAEPYPMPCVSAPQGLRGGAFPGPAPPLAYWGGLTGGAGRCWAGTRGRLPRDRTRSFPQIQRSHATLRTSSQPSVLSSSWRRGREIGGLPPAQTLPGDPRGTAHVRARPVGFPSTKLVSRPEDQPQGW